MIRQFLIYSGKITMIFNARSGILMVAVVAVLNIGDLMAQGVELDTDKKRYSYAVGTKIASQLAQQFNNSTSGIDMHALVEGISDIINNAGVKMSEQEATDAIAVQQQDQMNHARMKSELTVMKGNEYRAANLVLEGVVETESGLQYSIIESGDQSSEQPTSEDTVVVHYRGTLIDGTEFDSSYTRGEPTTFPLNGIIPGWIEVLQLMRPGDKWSVVIPPELAYGERGAGGQIGPQETLVFEIELLEIK
jgi:FKBP-type peptidyl-prolyl cis-trans isomerase FklB